MHTDTDTVDIDDIDAALDASADDKEQDAAPTFAELGVPKPLVHVLAMDGKVTAFPIQADTLADSLNGVDLLGRELGWTLEATHDELVHASAAMVNDEPVALIQEAGSKDWWESHANGRQGPLPANLGLFDKLEDVDPKQFAAVLWISNRKMPTHYAGRLIGRCVTYRPLPLPPDGSHRIKIALGLGCDRNTPISTVRAAINEALAVCHASLADIAAVASIDLKADEPALLQLAQEENWSIQFYPASALAKIDVPNPSETVRTHTGTPSVSEAAALLVAATDKRHLIIEKHRHQGPDGRNATVSIARIPE